MPGQTRLRLLNRRTGSGTFNGGPDNCPARPIQLEQGALVPEPSMEGRTIARPDAAGTRRPRPRPCPSMEGRTIARPDDLNAPGIEHHHRPSMEGRTIARPDVESPFFNGSFILPSMEGRTIARPDMTSRNMLLLKNLSLQWRAGQLPGQTLSPKVSSRRTPPFNGGPDNCPARHREVVVSSAPLRPSMEGRTIARPDTA